MMLLLMGLFARSIDAQCQSLNVPDPGLGNGRANSQAGVFGVYTRFAMPDQADLFTRTAPSGVTYRLYKDLSSSSWDCAPVWRIADTNDMAYGGVVKILSNATDATLILPTDQAVGLELYGRPPLNALQLACMDAPTPAPVVGSPTPAPTLPGGAPAGSQMPPPPYALPTPAPTVPAPAQTGGEVAVGIIGAVLLVGGGGMYYKRHRLHAAAANFRGDATQLFGGSQSQVNPFQASAASSSGSASTNAPYQAALTTHSSDL
jgi:hypothetical protein